MKAHVPLFVLCACSGAPAVQVQVTPPAAKLSGLAVRSLVLHQRTDDFEGAKRTLDVLEALWRDTTWLLIGPDEFRPPRAGDRDFLRGSDLVLVARRLGVDPHRLAILEGSVSTRQAVGEAEVSGRDVEVGHDFAGEVAITLSLYAVEGDLIGEVVHTVKLDPLAEKPEWDPRPELRAGLRQALTALTSACHDCFLPSWRPDFPITASPALLLTARDPAGRALRERIAAADPLEQDQLLWTSLMYVDPTLDLRAAQRHKRNPSAACIGEGAKPPLAAGDCIVRLNGEPFAGPHVLGQLLRAGGRVELSVVSPSGAARTIAFP
jgi:hypothetical protein